jgi:DNA (cytosine-5)-methyltransferase 1
MLDLFCGEGLGACGYWLSGRFDEIVGVDLNPEMRTRYSFNFLCADALQCDYEFLASFDFIHASPPCQAYSHMRLLPGSHVRLIAATHLMLYSSGKPYCIENVEGAKPDLKPNIAMDGHYFGLPMERRRYFHLSTLTSSIRLMKSGQSIDVHGGDYVSREKLIEAFGLSAINPNQLNKLTRNGMEQGIAPSMTRAIAEIAFPNKVMIGEKST